MAAFRTCVKVGLIPHARQGGRGVWMFAVAGSKFDGTGFEKLQMVQTHVAVLEEGGSIEADRRGLSDRWRGDAVPFLDGVDESAGKRDCSEDRLESFGIKVTLGEDFRNPAWRQRVQHSFSGP